MTTGLMYLYRQPKLRVPVGTRADWEAIEKLRDAVAFLHKHGAPATLEQEVTIALESHVAGLSARFNGGDRFPTRTEALMQGRRGGGIHTGKPRSGTYALSPEEKQRLAEMKDRARRLP
jgi:hypothetical protein